MNTIVSYYKVCGIKQPEDVPTPITTQVSSKSLGLIFTKKQEEIYFKEDHEIKENVVGGEEYDYFAEEEEPEEQKIMVF